jgi:hypothetical protein
MEMELEPDRCVVRFLFCRAKILVVRCNNRDVAWGGIIIVVVVVDVEDDGIVEITTCSDGGGAGGTKGNDDSACSNFRDGSNKLLFLEGLFEGGTVS